MISSGKMSCFVNFSECAVVLSLERVFLISVAMEAFASACDWMIFCTHGKLWSEYANLVSFSRIVSSLSTVWTSLRVTRRCGRLQTEVSRRCWSFSNWDV